MIRDRLGRGSRSIKCYINLFVYLTTKAIHFEAVTSLTTAAFLAALRRFTARRGKPQNIYSDNGTTFQGANKELQNFCEWLQISQNQISKLIDNQGIHWHYIPPYSPNLGRIWEADVKSTKHHLKRILGNSTVTFEELYTILTQVEAILNSRPITILSSNPNDIQALTPAHLLIGRSYVSIADTDVRDVSTKRLTRYQHLQQLSQQFWAHWSTEYITQLQGRSKWKKQSTNIQINTIVLVKDENLPPCLWLLGRVVTLHSGKEKVVRVLSVQCASKVIKRSVTKVCPLPINETQTL